VRGSGRGLFLGGGNLKAKTEGCIGYLYCYEVLSDMNEYKM
jgi:hypothetical protein